MKQLYAYSIGKGLDHVGGCVTSAGSPKVLATNRSQVVKERDENPFKEADAQTRWHELEGQEFEYLWPQKGFSLKIFLSKSFSQNLSLEISVQVQLCDHLAVYLADALPIQIKKLLSNYAHDVTASIQPWPECWYLRTCWSLDLCPTWALQLQSL